MNTQEQAYIYGFVKRANAYGFDENETVHILKYASNNTEHTIRVECPSDTGVRVQRFGNNGQSQPLNGPAKKWHDLVKKYRSENPGKKFNVLNFKVKADDTFTTESKFDNKIQKEFEENTK
jgi:hypothetical protein